MSAQTYGPCRVLKYEIDVRLGLCVDLPASAMPLAVAMADGPTHVNVWVQVPVDGDGKPLPGPQRRFEVYGTGHVIPADRRFVGTTMGWGLVWHVYEKRSAN